MLTESYAKEPLAWLRKKLRLGQLLSWEDPGVLLEELESDDHVWLVAALPDRGIRNRWGDTLSRQLVESVRCQSADGWYNLAYRFYSMLRWPFAAELACRKAIDIDPNFVLAWNGLGNLLGGHFGRFEEAETAYRKAIEIDNEFVRGWFNLGDLLQNHFGRLEEAEGAYRTAIELDPNCIHAWNGLGNLLQDYLGRLDEAEIAHRRAVSLSSGSRIPDLNLIFLLRDCQGNFSESRLIFDRIRNTGSDVPDTIALQEAIFAAYDGNLGIVIEELKKAFRATEFRLHANTRDDWFRASAVLLHLGLGRVLLRSMEADEIHLKMSPFYEALRAGNIGDKRALLDVCVEVRAAAEKIFDEIEIRRKRLPERTKHTVESPE